MGLPRELAKSVPPPVGVVKAPAYGWVIGVLLLLFMMLNFADKTVLGLSATRIMKDLDITPTQFGLVSTAFFIPFVIMAVGVGFLTNRVKTKTALGWMALVWAIAQFPMGLAIAGYGMLLATRALLGAGEGPAYPVANHAIQKWFPDRNRSWVSSIIGSGPPLGVVVATPLLAFVIFHYDWRAAFVLTGALSLAWAVLWFFMGKEGEVRDEASAGAANTTPIDEDRPTVPTWRILLSGTWLASVAGGFAAYWVVAMIISWLPAYLEAEGFSLQDIAFLGTLPWVAQIVAMALQAFVSHTLLKRGASTRAARGIVGAIFVFCSGLATVGFVMAAPGPVKIILMAIGLGAAAVILPISQVAAAEIAHPGQRGGVLGTYTAVYSLAGVTAPVVTGMMIQNAGDPLTGYRSAFLVAAVLMIVAGLVVAVFVRPRRDKERLEAIYAR